MQKKATEKPINATLFMCRNRNRTAFMQKTVDKDVGRDRFAAAQTLQHIERLTGEHLEILLNGRQRRLQDGSELFLLFF